MKEVAKIGGNNIYDFIKRIMNMLITNEFAAKFSWYGAKKKRIFGGLKLAEVLLGKKLM